MKANWFVGLPVPAGWLPQLLATAPEPLRRFHPQDLHITVAFLSACGPERAQAAWRACSQALVATPPPAPLQAQLGALRPFGPARRYSALSFVLRRGQQQLAALIAQLRPLALQAAQLPPADRPPLPHVTIGRPARRATAQVRRELLLWADGLTPADELLSLTRLALFTWSEQRPARQFRIVAEQALPLA